MATHKYFDRICCVILALTLVLSVLFMNAEQLGVQKASAVNGYERRLFDTSTVHTIDIVMDDWDGFLESCTNEEYVQCAVVIDNEAYKNVAIRAKGNTSLSNVQSYGNDRYSFKIEFDHYDNTKTYYGLDKLSLNNIIQDNTYMKDYLTYQMMGNFGVRAPLCSYVQILVNGEEWGLYLAVEGVEDAFLSRNYGNDAGELYKPDSMSMGGGRGNGDKFDMDNWQENTDASAPQEGQQGSENSRQDGAMQPPDGTPFEPGDMPDGNGQSGGNMQPPTGDSSGETANPQPQDSPTGNAGFPEGSGAPGRMGSSDVALIYTDDSSDSYANIFDNAKTDLTDADKARLIASLKKLNENSGIADVVNVDEVLRYFVVHNFVCNFDSYTGSMMHNYYLYEQDGRLSMIPWDYNLAFGGFGQGTDTTSLVNYPIDTPVSGANVEERPMLSWIFADDTYIAQYHQYFSEFIAQFFDSGPFAETIDRVTALIAPYVQSDPTKFCTYEEFEQGAETLKQFCLLRAESVNAQLVGAIATTAESQEKDTLIDASSITISDMGSMGSMGGGKGMAMPGASAEQTGNAPQKPDGAMQPPGNSNNGKPQPPVDTGNAQNMPQNGAAPTSGTSYLLLGICGAVLLIGLLLAVRYKKRV